MAIKYSKWSENISTFTIQRPSKIYPHWDFWCANKPYGNPALRALVLLYTYVAAHVLVVDAVTKMFDLSLDSSVSPAVSNFPPIYSEPIKCFAAFIDEEFQVTLK
jgi:hypothetical protein